MQEKVSQNFDLGLGYFFYNIKHKIMSKNNLKICQCIINKFKKA